MSIQSPVLSRNFCYSRHLVFLHVTCAVSIGIIIIVSQSVPFYLSAGSPSISYPDSICQRYDRDRDFVTPRLTCNPGDDTGLRCCKEEENAGIFHTSLECPGPDYSCHFASSRFYATILAIGCTIIIWLISCCIASIYLPRLHAITRPQSMSIQLQAIPDTYHNQHHQDQPIQQQLQAPLMHVNPQQL